MVKKVAGTFVPKKRNFHRVELLFPGTFAPWNFRSLNITDNGKWFKTSKVGWKNTPGNQNDENEWI